MDQLTEFQRKNDYQCWCGDSGSRKVCHQLWGRRHFVVLGCNSCGSHRILPRALAEQSQAETLYNEYEIVVSDKELANVMRRVLKRYTEVGLPLSPDVAVLDVGCGSGYLLNAICDTYGCVGKGIDVDERRIAIARSRAKRAEFECGLFDSKRLERRYDIVMLNAVIEHVIDPVGLLSELHSALVPTGSLFVLTPNAASLNYRLLGSWWRELLSIGEHIYLFTPESLINACQKANFRPITYSSAFDFVVPWPKLTSAKEALLSAWAIYRESIKRLSSLVGNAHNRDILYGHFRKSDSP
jgi:2-polyprenyl-3-methyl-5-hydroxy-6-metoxy-1,4-benzoquinol methylase